MGRECFEQFDSETGFTFLRARYLDPRLGRFLSTDSVQPNAPGTQGYNPYAYAANNPTTWVDPSGHFPFIALGLIIIPVGAILVCALTPWCNGAWQRARDTIDKYGNDTREGVQEWTIDRLRQAKNNFPHPPGVKRAGECVGDLEECGRDLTEEVLKRTYSQRAPLTIELEQLFRQLSDGDYHTDPQDPGITIITNCRGICEFVQAPAFTIGHTIFTTQPTIEADTLAEERRHVDQFELLGDGFWPTWALSGLASLVGCLYERASGGSWDDYGDCLHDSNILELLAR
jgi:RHS repeat-associated protein